MIEIHREAAFSDNYIWLIHDTKSKATAAVDPGAAEPVLSALSRRGWTLSHILNTHHHSDHVGGNLELKAKTGCRIIGSERDRARIPGIDQTVGEGEIIQLGAAQATVLEVAGHTSGHIAFWFAADEALFCGDTLFALGCGRLFEGDAREMWSSLAKIRNLPETTRIYCAHEYTLANGRFALSIDPRNEALKKRYEEVEKARRLNHATVPSILREELATNPFLRPDDGQLRSSVGASELDEDWVVIGKIRQLKDRFAD